MIMEMSTMNGPARSWLLRRPPPRCFSDARRPLAREGRSGALVDLGGRDGLRLVVACLFAVLLTLPARAVPPIPTACQNDLQGANDEPGQKDLTRYCADPGSGDPYEVHTLWNWDLVTLPGGNTGDGCILFDTDADFNVNLAVCVTIRDGGQPATLGSIRLFTCADTQPDRCTDAQAVGIYSCSGGTNPGAACSTESDCHDGGYCQPSGKNTTCHVSQQDTDPFPTGDSYPRDTQAVCSIDINDFEGVTTARIVDVCSYPAQVPNSDPSDCITVNDSACTDDFQCDDSNSCTTDTCDMEAGLCRYAPVSAGEACGSPSDTECDNPDTCNDQGLCQPNYEPSTTTCTGAFNDGDCDAMDHCSGTADSCIDEFQPSSRVCRAAEGACDVPEYCGGASSACPTDGFADQGTPCGSDCVNACDDADTCNGFGFCLANNRPCSSVTSSSLSTYDVAECLDRRQFKLLFTPDVQAWPSYKLTASVPGQTFYNAVVEGVDGTDVVTVTIPYPFVTEGGKPLHRYDVAGWVIGQEGRRHALANLTTCSDGGVGHFNPGLEVESKSMRIKLEDYGGSYMDWGNGVTVTCPEFPAGACGEAGSLFGSTCIIQYTTEIPTGEQAYINVHLDYGLKGASVNGNPCDGSADRYDNATAVSCASTSSALAQGTAIVAIPDNQEYVFSHTPGSSYTVRSINAFKRIAGTFGRAEKGAGSWWGDGDGLSGKTVKLVNSAGQVVKKTVTDPDGYYLLEYMHRGRPGTYYVRLYSGISACDVDGGGKYWEIAIELKSNGWSEVNFRNDFDPPDPDNPSDQCWEYWQGR